MSVMRSLFVAAALSLGGGGARHAAAQNNTPENDATWWHKVGLTIPMLSYHSVRYRPYNENNVGLIVNYDVTGDAWRKRNRAINLFAGGYHNSLRGFSPTAGVEISKKWGHVTLALPVGVVGYQKRADDIWDQNGNRIFVAHGTGPTRPFPWAAPRVCVDFVKNRAGIAVMGGYWPGYGGLATSQLYCRLGPR